MSRIFNLVLLAVMLAAAAVTYGMKHRAEVAADQVARLEREIAREKDALQLLRAEWAVLTQPGRLQSVIERYDDYFQLSPFSPEQIATIEEIPMRSFGETDQVRELIARLATSQQGRIE